MKTAASNSSPKAKTPAASVVPKTPNLQKQDDTEVPSPDAEDYSTEGEFDLFPDYTFAYPPGESSLFGDEFSFGDPTTQIDWFSMSRPYFDRAVPQLRYGDFEAIEARWMDTFRLAQTLGFDPDSATWVSNQLTPIAIDSALKGDYPTAFELSNRELGLSPTMVNAPAIHFKLEVGAPNDPLEQEADAVADKVMRTEETFLQRKCASCEQEEELQMKPLPQKKTSHENRETTTPWIEQQIQHKRGSGHSLPIETRSFMESAIGASFQDVKVHTDSTAVQMNRELGARAFTVGSNIYFNSGKYSPHSSEGKKLLAHELTHTVQQKKSKQTIQRSGWLGALIGGGLGAGIGAGIGAAVGGGVGALVGGLIGAGVGALVGGLIGHYTSDSDTEQLANDAGNTEILSLIRQLISERVPQRTARQIMGVLDNLSANRLRLIVMELARSSDYESFREKIVNPVQDDYQSLEVKISNLFNEYSNPTQNTQDATPEQQEEVRDILNQGMNVDATGNVAAFEDVVDGRSFDQDVTATLENEITALTPRAGQRDVLPRFDWPRYEEIANEAKERTDDLYGHYATGSALTSSGADRNLFDVRDETYSDADLIQFANYLVTGHNAIDPVYPGESILNKHNADMNRSDESDILSQAISNWLAVPGNRDRILLVRRNWSGVQSGGNIYIQRWRRPEDDANRTQFWDTFQTMIHEYLHKVTHDDYSARARTLGRTRQQVFTEGGTSYFDRNVWQTLWPNEIQSNAELRQTVEGGEYEYDASLIPDWSGYRQVGQFEQIVAVVGEENARAAYFRGEVEKIGMP